MPTVTYLGAGTTQIVAQCEGIDSNVCAVTVSPAPPPPGGLYPNIGPCTLTNCEWLPSAVPTNTTFAVGTGGVRAGSVTGFFVNPGGIITVAGPNGETTAFRYIWPAGTAPGTNPSSYSFGGWPTEAVEQYMCWYLRFPDPTFQYFWNGGIKMFGFLKVGPRASAGDGGSDNRCIISSRGNASPATAGSCDVQLQNEAPLFTRPGSQFLMRMGSGFLRLEMRFRLNSSPGAADGRFRCWVNGTLQDDWGDVPYRPAGYTHGFFGWYWNPTWGGNGGANLPSDQRLDVCRAYFSCALA